LANRVIEDSPKLKRSRLDAAIAEQNVVVARSGYYPSLRAVGGYEYSKKFDAIAAPSYAGEESFTQSSGRIVSSSVYLSYDLFHFGATKFAIDAAYANLDATRRLQCVKEKESLLDLLEAYSKVRSCNHKLEAYKQMLDLYTELYVFAKRLHEVGRLPKTDGLKYAEELANVAALIADIKEERAVYLARIAYLSGEEVGEGDSFAPLKSGALFSEPPRFEESVAAGRLRAVIAGKRAELDLRRTRYYPSLSIYGKYDAYGYSTDSSKEAYNDFSRNGYRIGVTLSWSLFSGFRDSAESEIEQLELMQSMLDYEDAKRAYETELSAINSQIKFQQNKLNDAQRGLELSLELSRADDLMYEAGEMDKIALLNDSINQRKVGLELKEAKELLAASLKKREITNEKEYLCVAR
jgi:outer membrane protein TolC